MREQLLGSVLARRQQRRELGTRIPTDSEHLRLGRQSGRRLAVVVEYPGIMGPDLGQRGQSSPGSLSVLSRGQSRGDLDHESESGMRDLCYRWVIRTGCNERR